MACCSSRLEEMIRAAKPSDSSEPIPRSPRPLCQFQSSVDGMFGHSGSADCDGDSEFRAFGTDRSEDEGLTGDSTATRESEAGERSPATTDCLGSWIAPRINKQVDDALKPLLSILRGVEEDENKHQEKLLAIEKRKLALENEKIQFFARHRAPSWNSPISQLQVGLANSTGNVASAFDQPVKDGTEEKGVSAKPSSISDGSLHPPNLSKTVMKNKSPVDEKFLSIVNKLVSISDVVDSCLFGNSNKEDHSVERKNHSSEGDHSHCDKNLPKLDVKAIACSNVRPCLSDDLNEGDRSDELEDQTEVDPEHSDKNVSNLDNVELACANVRSCLSDDLNAGDRPDELKDHNLNEGDHRMDVPKVDTVVQRVEYLELFREDRVEKIETLVSGHPSGPPKLVTEDETLDVTKAVRLFGHIPAVPIMRPCSLGKAPAVDFQLRLGDSRPQPAASRRFSSTNPLWSTGAAKLMYGQMNLLHHHPESAASQEFLSTTDGERTMSNLGGSDMGTPVHPAWRIAAGHHLELKLASSDDDDDDMKEHEADQFNEEMDANSAKLSHWRPAEDDKLIEPVWEYSLQPNWNLIDGTEEKEASAQPSSRSDGSLQPPKLSKTVTKDKTPDDENLQLVAFPAVGSRHSDKSNEGDHSGEGGHSHLDKNRPKLDVKVVACSNVTSCVTDDSNAGEVSGKLKDRDLSEGDHSHSVDLPKLDKVVQRVEKTETLVSGHTSGPSEIVTEDVTSDDTKACVKLFGEIIWVGEKFVECKALNAASSGLSKVASLGNDKILSKPDKHRACPRCHSFDTKFCYFNNNNINKPRHFCKNCRRYWTVAGTVRNFVEGLMKKKNEHRNGPYHEASQSSDRLMLLSQASAIVSNTIKILPTPSDTLHEPVGWVKPSQPYASSKGPSITSGTETDYDSPCSYFSFGQRHQPVSALGKRGASDGGRQEAVQLPPKWSRTVATLKSDRESTNGNYLTEECPARTEPRLQIQPSSSTFSICESSLDPNPITSNRGDSEV